jgi:hypothetical protein
MDSPPVFLADNRTGRGRFFGCRETSALGEGLLYYRQPSAPRELSGQTGTGIEASPPRDRNISCVAIGTEQISVNSSGVKTSGVEQDVGGRGGLVVGSMLSRRTADGPG